MNYLSIIAIFKNETMNLKVWIEHYLWQGVEHFYLIDNGSTDEPLKILQEYIDKNIVDYYYRERKHYQRHHYRKVFDMSNIKNKTKWLIVCDLDEFFYSPNFKLSTTLKSFENYDVIYSSWIMFGSDGLKEHPKDIRIAITHRKEIEKKPKKYICKVSKIDSSNIDIHTLVPSKSNNLNNIISIHDDENFRLNHYRIQSLEYYMKVKMVRGDVVSKDWNKMRDMKYFNDDNENCDINDETLKNLVLFGKENY